MFFDGDAHVVEAVHADDLGGVRLAMSGGYLLEVFSDEAPGGRYEHWRFLQPNREGAHFVVTGGGIEE